MIVSIERRTTYIPEWRGNKAETAPIKVHYRYATTEERDKFIHWSSPSVEASVGEAAISKVVRLIERKDMFLALVEKIENLSVNEGGKEKPITTPRELLETPGLNDLYDEIVGVLIQSTAVADLKN